MKTHLIKIFERVIEVILAVMLIFILIGISIGGIRLFVNLIELWQKPGITGQYLSIISDVLTLFIVIELSRSMVEYFTSHHLRITFILDAGIVFMIREVMIKVFEKEISPQTLYAFSAFLLVLGAMRIGSVIFFQKEKH